jgi:hypothetical protein
MKFFFIYTGTVINFILYIQHEIKEEEEHDDDGEARVEDDNGDMEEEVVDDDDHTLEADSLEEEEPAATSTPRRGHLPRPLVRSGFEFLIRIYQINN